MFHVIRWLGLVAVLTGGLLHTVNATSAQIEMPRATSPEGHDSKLCPYPIVGTWRWDHDPAHPNTPISYGVFHANGTYEEVIPGARTAVGAWQATGERTVVVTYVSQEVLENPAIVEPGTTTISLMADVRPSGHVVVANVSYVVQRLDGTVLDQADLYQAQGSRIVVEPMALFDRPWGEAVGGLRCH